MGEQNTIKVQPTNQTERLYTQKVVDGLQATIESLNNELLGLRKGAEISEWRDRAIKAEAALKEIKKICAEKTNHEIKHNFSIVALSREIETKIDEVLNV